MPNLEELDFSIDWGENGNAILKIEDSVNQLPKMGCTEIHGVKINSEKK